MNEHFTIPLGYEYPKTIAWFSAGAVITSVFSASLAVLVTNVELAKVLIIGILVPSFTWVVQLIASGFVLSTAGRRMYWGDLGRVCFIGSVALIPAAVINLWLRQVPLWVSALNVLVSVAIMGRILFQLSAQHQIKSIWPISWCFTITVNMMLFVWSSWGWWRAA